MIGRVSTFGIVVFAMLSLGLEPSLANSAPVVSKDVGLPQTVPVMTLNVGPEQVGL